MDNALSNLSERRVQIGAELSSLDSRLNQNLILSENLAQARSLAEDADYAIETAELVKHQILQQTSLAVMSQISANMQIILQLLPSN